MIVSHWKLFLGLAADDPARNPNAKLPLSRRTPRPFLRVSVQPVGQSQKEFKQPFCSLPSCTKCCAATTNGDAWLELQAILTRPASAASCAWGLVRAYRSLPRDPAQDPARKVWKDFGRFAYVCKGQKPERSSETNFRAAAKAWMDEHRQSRNGTLLGGLSRAWEAGVECADCKLGRGQRFRLEWNQDAAEPDAVRLKIFSSGFPSTSIGT